jgi:FKBP-type peptidyl-prolyl cis-trans isomerase
MIKRWTLAVGFGLLTALAGAQTSAPAKPAAAPTKPATAAQQKPRTAAPAAASQDASQLATPKDKLSYAFGMYTGEVLRKQSADVDVALVHKGVSDALAGNKTLLTEEEMRTVLTEWQTAMQKKMDQARTQAGADNKKAGDAFLEENKKKEGVVALPSGLQYKVLKTGDGPKPTAEDTVVCQYRGTLIDGKEFDSSYKGGQPATFPVKGVIKGWTEALQLMPVGSKWQLFVPSDLAYGDRGAGPDIGPNSTLIFEVELVSIQAKK